MTDTVTIPRAEFEKVLYALESVTFHNTKTPNTPNWVFLCYGALAILEKHGGTK